MIKSNNRIAALFIAVSCGVLTGCGGSNDSPATLSCSVNEQPGAMTGGNQKPLVVPTLQSWSPGTGSMTINNASRIVVEFQSAVALKSVAARLAAQLKTVTGLNIPVTSSTQINPGDIALSLTPCGQSSSTAMGKEGYSLLADKGVTLRANTTNGVFYATQTLLQMLVLDGNPSGSHSTVTAGFALDYPQLSERSVSLDVGRKFASTQFLTDYMKFMGSYKLNTLHLHLSDQIPDADGNFLLRAFRLKSSNKSFNGPISSDGQYYSEQDWAGLEATAAANGIKIVPEFDTPAHAGAFVLARPDLMWAGDTGTNGSPAPGGTLDPTNPATLDYVKSVWNEFLPWFKSGVVHIGGDEAFKVPNEQQVAYDNALATYLENKGQLVEMWGEEALTQFGLKRSIRIQRWLAFPANSFIAQLAPSVFPGYNPDFNWSSYGNPWTESAGAWYSVPYSAIYPAVLSGDNIYDNWNNISTATSSATGGQIAEWNDCSVSGAKYCVAVQPFIFETDVNNNIKDAIPAAGQIFWKGQEMNAGSGLVPYSTLRGSVAKFQYGPDATMFVNSPIRSQ